MMPLNFTKFGKVIPYYNECVCLDSAALSSCSTRLVAPPTLITTVRSSSYAARGCLSPDLTFLMETKSTLNWPARLWGFTEQFCQIWTQSWLDWPQKGKSGTSTDYISVHFGSWNLIWKSPGLLSQNVWNLIWKSPGFVTFGANLTHFESKSGLIEFNQSSNNFYFGCEKWQFCSKY